MNHTTLKALMTPTKIKPRYQVTIPAAVRERVPLAVGDLVEVGAFQNFIVIKPKKVARRDNKKEIDDAIAEGLKDFEAGRFSGPFETAEELVAHLHRQTV